MTRISRWNQNLLLITITVITGLNAVPPSQRAVRAEAPAKNAPTTEGVTAQNPPTDEKGWRDLLPKDSLRGWKVTQFGGEGEVQVRDHVLTLQTGNPLTGITLDGPPAHRQNYEIRLEAQRASGNDFFCGLTFPVGDSYCSLILGGWGGALVGISCIDGFDASENETTQFEQFTNGRWYRVRLQVTPERIKVWLNDKSIIDQALEGHKLTTRLEVDLSQPIGLASFNTQAMIRGFQIRPIQKGK